MQKEVYKQFTYTSHPQSNIMSEAGFINHECISSGHREGVSPNENNKLV